MSMSPFSIVIVSYNSAAVLSQAIRSVPAGHEVIVVDNASSDMSADIARAEGASVLQMPTNLGFGAACNRGAALASHPLILFLNPDARLRRGALNALAKAFSQYPNCAAANPMIRGAGGKQFFRFRTKLLPRPYLRRPPLPTADCKITLLIGAALAIRRDIFEKVGGFDESIFLYFEDDDLSVRLLKAGYDLYYVHDAVVDHELGTGTPSTDEVLRFKEYQYTRSRVYVLAKHGRIQFRHLDMLKEQWSILTATTEIEKKCARARLEALRIKHP